jgi:hypothetical protein
MNIIKAQTTGRNLYKAAFVKKKHINYALDHGIIHLPKVVEGRYSSAL